MRKLILTCLFIGVVILYAYATGNEPALIALKVVIAVVFVFMLPFVKRVWEER